MGDPPNLIIGTNAGFSFIDFIINMGPLVLINMVVFLITMVLCFRKNFNVSRSLKAKVMDMDAKRAIKDKVLLKKSLAVFILVILGFLTNTVTHIGLAVISISGAATLVLLAKKDPEHVYSEVEWTTLFFFAGLFIIVDGLAATGIIGMIGFEIVNITGGVPETISMFTVALSTVLAPVLGSMTYTISFSKVLTEISSHLSGDVSPMWWALSMGACFGGNMTLLGSAANVVGSSMAAKAGRPISFVKFFKYGFFIALQSAILSIIYLKLRYF